eukprot:jgi/Mesen1/5404/ME000268S04603
MCPMENVKHDTFTNGDQSATYRGSLSDFASGSHPASYGSKKKRVGIQSFVSLFSRTSTDNCRLMFFSLLISMVVGLVLGVQVSFGLLPTRSRSLLWESSIGSYCAPGNGMAGGWRFRARVEQLLQAWNPDHGAYWKDLAENRPPLPPEAYEPYYDPELQTVPVATKRRRGGGHKKSKNFSLEERQVGSDDSSQTPEVGRHDEESGASYEDTVQLSNTSYSDRGWSREKESGSKKRNLEDTSKDESVSSDEFHEAEDKHELAKIPAVLFEGAAGRHPARSPELSEERNVHVNEVEEQSSLAGDREAPQGDQDGEEVFTGKQISENDAQHNQNQFDRYDDDTISRPSKFADTADSPQRNSSRRLLAYNEHKQLHVKAPPYTRPPHLEDCEAKFHRQYNEKWDRRGEDGSAPAWSKINPWSRNVSGEFGSVLPNGEDRYNPTEGPLSEVQYEGPFPPWIVGGDSENYPLTRRAQRDIWLHQHPVNCGGPDTKFLFMPFTPKGRHGVGAQLTTMAGALALAMTTGRVLVIENYDRANHSGCAGRHFGLWSCYFSPETSDSCRAKASELARDPRNFRGQNPRVKRNKQYEVMQFWYPAVPKIWGKPWEDIPPMVEAEGKLIHRSKSNNIFRWWRAQAWRYLMRFPTTYTCRLVNRARHDAFGRMVAEQLACAEAAMAKRAAKASTPVKNQPGAFEAAVWDAHRRPWVPRPLIGMHVRMGDKALEMRLAAFGEYMNLAERVRRHNPAASTVWLSSEMQSVIDNSAEYPGWHFMYSHIRRQRGNESMPSYELSLGPEASMANSFANLFIQLESDYFIGALGSAYSYLVDAMRCTSGKMLHGYLSANAVKQW